MRLFSTIKRHDLFLADTTQAEAAELLSKRYAKPKKFFIDFIREARKAGYIWDEIITATEVITIQLTSAGKLDTVIISDKER